ncbi:MAG: hypothetical protein JNK56_26235 [Myxococcales bacterium]|nr:hypothetical protein [Myxococcales bacterium]
MSAAPPPLPGPEHERALLAPWQAACAALLAAPPPVLAADDGGPILRFTSDGSRAHAAAIGRVDVYGDHPRVRAHLRALGYAWDERGYLATVPTPHSFRPRLRALGLAGGFTPEYHRTRAPYMSKRTWLMRQAAGAVPVALGGPGFYRLAVRLAPLAPPAWREHLRYHLHGVQHDMTKHALCLHLVPDDQIASLGARARELLERAIVPPEPLGRFYENDLPAYCQAIWRDLPDPGEFVPTFTRPRNLAQLHAALALRLAPLGRGLRSLPAWLRDPTGPRPTFQIERAPRIVRA